MPLSPRQDWMREHLETLFRPAFSLGAPPLRFELRCIHPTMRNNNKAVVSADCFPLTEKGITEGISWATEMNQKNGYNVYVGANPRRPTAPHGAAEAADVYPFFAWCFTDADSPEAVNRLRDNPGPLHKMLVVTGIAPAMRVHCYWQLEDPITNPEAWTQAQKHLQRAFGTDAVHDTPRILRLAGSISYPDEKKAAKGYRTEIVQVQVYDDRDDVAAEGLLAIPAPEAASPSAEASGERALHGSLHLAAPGINAETLIEAIRQGENLHNNTRDLIAHLVGIGQPDWAIQSLCEELLQGRSDGGTLSQVPGLIGGARAKWNKPNPAEISHVLPVTSSPESEGPIPAVDLLTDPPPRQWIIENWIIKGAVNSLYGDGGVGKTLLAQQIATCVSTGAPFLDLPTEKMPVLAVLCEDDKGEIHRRQYAMTNALKLGFNEGLKECRLWPRVGADNFLLSYAGGRPMMTPFYQQVSDHLQSLGTGPKLLILDTLADLFGGDEIQRVQANYFVKTTLGALALATNSTVLLLAHPSRAGLQTGDMLSGSTAWHNAVRSRLALQWMKTDDDDQDPDLVNQRLLTRPKANYAQANAEIPIEYREGAFFPIKAVGSPIEQQGQRQTIRDEVARMAARKTPLGLSPRSSFPLKKHRFKRYGKRIMPNDAERIVNELLDSKILEIRQNKDQPWGLYPKEPMT